MVPDYISGKLKLIPKSPEIKDATQIEGMCRSCNLATKILDKVQDFVKVCINILIIFFHSAYLYSVQSNLKDVSLLVTTFVSEQVIWWMEGSQEKMKERPFPHSSTTIKSPPPQSKIPCHHGLLTFKTELWIK